jgi:hypothetical protein
LSEAKSGISCTAARAAGSSPGCRFTRSGLRFGECKPTIGEERAYVQSAAGSIFIVRAHMARGFVAKFSDGTVTDSTWKAQSFYIAPLQHPDDVVEYGNMHDTSHLGGRIHPLAKLPTCREHCFAIHYAIPDGWMNPNFDDSKWPRAFEYLDQEVGIYSVSSTVVTDPPIARAALASHSVE